LTINLELKDILEEKDFIQNFQEKIKLRPALNILGNNVTIKDDVAPLVDMRTYE